MSFQDQCRKVFTDNTAARLARWGGFGHRAAQKFLAAKADVPQDIVDAIELQQLLLFSDDPTAKIRLAVDEAIGKGIAKEAVASRLSALHKELTGVDIS